MHLNIDLNVPILIEPKQNDDDASKLLFSMHFLEYSVNFSRTNHPDLVTLYITAKYYYSDLIFFQFKRV